MHSRAINCFAMCVLFVLVPIASAADDLPSQQEHHEHDAHPADETPLGFSLGDGWLDPWRHADLSRRGTPFVHLFGLEPAFLDRSVILSYAFTDADDEREHEFEAEIEWALTRRIGLLIEAPYAVLNPDVGPTEHGIGDTVIGGRFLLAEFDWLLVSANLGVSLPTGSEDRGLGSGEVGLEPSVSLWLDLGNWITFNAQAGTEHGVESGDDVLFYNAALAWSFRAPALFGRGTGGHADHLHFPPGLTSLIAEFSGEVVLNGADDGRATQELLLGVSHNLTQVWELRGGYQIPLGRPRDFDSGYVVSLLRHF